MTVRTGRCMCGAVTYKAEVSGVFSACHCKMCQQWASGLFMGVHTDGFELTGGDLTRFKSSDWAERAFCAKCGSNIYYHAVEYGHPSVALGTLDDTSGLTRRFEFYTDLEPERLGRPDETKTMTQAEAEAFFTEAADDQI